MPRKGENIYKRKDGRWEGRYIKSKLPTVKTVYGYVYAKTYRDVKAKLYRAAISCPKASNDSITARCDCFSIVASEWFDNIVPQIKDSTANKYRNLLHSYFLSLISTLLRDFLFIQSRSAFIYGAFGSISNKSAFTSSAIICATFLLFRLH